MNEVFGSYAPASAQTDDSKSISPTRKESNGLDSKNIHRYIKNRKIATQSHENLYKFNNFELHQNKKLKSQYLHELKEAKKEYFDEDVRLHNKITNKSFDYPRNLQSLEKKLSSKTVLIQEAINGLLGISQKIERNKKFNKCGKPIGKVIP